MELLSLLVGTIVLRPYFVAFFLTYLLACSLHMGVKRALLFSVAGYAVAWLSEFSSIHNGIPYGYYYYIEATRGQELWMLGVPFMDSMSFVFLSYASYSTALLAIAPVLPGRGLYLLENRRIRQSMRVRVTGALFFVYLDIIIDPVALRGDRWFLGQIYGYPGGGVYFGVPISNFVGWFVVGFALIYTLQTIDRLLNRRKAKDLAGWSCPWRYFLGPALYAGIILFNLSVTFFIGEYNLVWTGIFIVLLPLALLVSFLRSQHDRANLENAIEAHIGDFPRAILPGKEPSVTGKRPLQYPQ